MAFFDTFLSPKARARVIIRIRTADSVYIIQNLVKSWGVPGCMRPIDGGAFDIELEARQTTILERLQELSRNPVLATHSLQIQWLPYTGRFSAMTINF